MPAFSRFLRYFMTVGRLGSIRKAADQLNVSASAIDRQILNAEAELGMPLFERLPTGLRLTAAGEIVMAAGARWQKGLSEVRAQIEDLRGLKRGHVTLAIMDALTKGYIPARLRTIQNRYPGISVDVRVMANEHIRGAIASGEVDFGICFDPQTFRDLTVLAYANIRLGFVVPADHPFARQGSARFSACAGMPMILPAPPLAVAQQVQVLAGTSKMPLDRKSSSDNIQMITSLVLEGVGIGLLTSLDVANEVRAGQLAFVPLTDPVLKPMTLALCTATSRATSYAADVVLQEIQNSFAALDYMDPS
ncbi:DNA-binding transcriptional LysR family regulator [Novosphingobium capsulatum]|uniref:DNA-binding transcriptional LysR family regulator n=1 Tax=Novosphingobium capsulatum TaxID=13688 RepID=A0ABU1MHV0_9SPHN|nr:LysR family transcriptional regulator [Novosphingobium capsulatum]MDR6509910.1 DNA-binding transcriptional LysR family regulator [Novosphingobium capsulatum]